MSLRSGVGPSRRLSGHTPTLPLLGDTEDLAGRRGLVLLRRAQSFAAWPMAFVMTVTLSSLVIQALAAFHGAAVGGPRLDPATLNGVVSVLLLGLALVLIREAVRAVRLPTRLERPGVGYESS